MHPLGCGLNQGQGQGAIIWVPVLLSGNDSGRVIVTHASLRDVNIAIHVSLSLELAILIGCN